MVKSFASLDNQNSLFVERREAALELILLTELVDKPSRLVYWKIEMIQNKVRPFLFNHSICAVCVTFCRPVVCLLMENSAGSGFRSITVTEDQTLNKFYRMREVSTLPVLNKTHYSFISLGLLVHRSLPTSHAQG